MKKNILSEEEFEKQERFDLLDYYDAFLKIFKQWVADRFAVEVEDFPISYLVEKYKKEFYEEILEEKFESVDDVPDISRWTMQEIVMKLMKKQKVKIPSLRKTEKFTEKYKSTIPIFIKRLELPDFVKIQIDEPKPYELEVSVKYDFPKTLNYTEKIHVPSYYSNKLKEYFERYLNVKEGSPVYGDMRFDYKREPVLEGLDEWVKNFLNKKIKKDIKQMTDNDRIKSIRFTPDINRSELKIIFSQMRHTPWEMKKKIMQSVKDYLTNIGLTKIKIDSNY